MADDAMYMRRAIQLAGLGAGWVSPNPMVGAVVVRDGRILSEGYHARCGDLHAERSALTRCTEDCTGATLYVTLEPCCHQGRTPPCTDIILEKKLAQVVIGSRDPNPKVAGRGAQILRDAGLEVVEDFLRAECDAVNPVFFHYITTKTPYVAMKYAMTLDGKVACRTGLSQWITGEAARAHVQTLRHYYRGILVGIGTVLADNPRLTCRMEGGRSPIRIVCDSRLEIPLDCNLVQTARETPTIVACARPEPEKQAALEQAGVTVLTLPGPDGRVDLPALMAELGRREIDGILLEGGAGLNAAMAEAGLVQRVYCYVAPKLFGGTTAPSPLGGLGAANPAQALLLTEPTIQRFGADVLLTCEVRS